MMLAVLMVPSNQSSLDVQVRGSLVSGNISQGVDRGRRQGHTQQCLEVITHDTLLI